MALQRYDTPKYTSSIMAFTSLLNYGASSTVISHCSWLNERNHSKYMKIGQKDWVHGSLCEASLLHIRVVSNGSCKPYHGKPHPTLANHLSGFPLSYITPPIWVTSIITKYRAIKWRESETPHIPLNPFFSIDNGNTMHVRLQCSY